jgi:hypothetical protein
VSTTKDIAMALQRKAGFECLEEGGITVVRDVQLRLMGRVPQSAEKSWKRVRNQIQQAVRAGKPWTADISRWYFLLDGTDTELFAWRILLQAAGGAAIAQFYDDILSVIATVPVVAQVDVMEFPIPSASRRNMSTEGGRRGAGPAGSVAFGPNAVRNKNQGG